MACDIIGFTWTASNAAALDLSVIKGVVEFTEEAFNDPVWALQGRTEQLRNNI